MTRPTRRTFSPAVTVTRHARRGGTRTCPKGENRTAPATHRPTRASAAQLRDLEASAERSLIELELNPKWQPLLKAELRKLEARRRKRGAQPPSR